MTLSEAVRAKFPTWLGPRRSRTVQGQGLLVGMALGLLGVAALWGQTLLALGALYPMTEPPQMTEPPPTGSVLATGPAQAAAPAGVPATALVRDVPYVSERDAAWLWLQQRLQAHRLQVDTLKTEALRTGAAWVGQEADVRVQGAWADWVVFGEQLAAHAPWWQCLQWQVLPLDDEGQVQVQARVRLWLQADEGARPEARPWPQWPQWPVAIAPQPTRLFAHAQAPRVGPAAPEQAPVADAAWRLWGVWQQAERVHVVVGHGADWQMLAPGQVLGSEGDRLDRVGPEGVFLKKPGASQVRLVPWGARP